MRPDVYKIVQDRILAALDSGTVPWHKPWNTAGIMPTNLVSKRPYRGVNVWLLRTAPYASPYWLTFKQARMLGGSVRKGERGWPVVFWKKIMVEKQDETGKREKYPVFLLRYYTVFNLEQTDGIPDKKIPKQEPTLLEPIDAAEAMIDGYLEREAKLQVIVKPSDRAFYAPLTDTITVPELNQYKQREAYYCTMLHELAHSTGHASRLKRKGIVEFDRFGSHQYSQEELVAELCAAMLCGVLGIEDQTIDQNASYIDSWRKKISEDKKLVVMAAAQAHHAADLIRGIEPDTPDDAEED
jgi:antirestriction protein ArdC